METGRWNNHVFTVSPKVIRGFTGLTVKGSSETEDMESGSQYHIARKAGQPAEVSLTVNLSALTGCKVREEAMALVSDARAGAHNYFYVGGKKLMNCELMLTQAHVENVIISPKGVWVSADVQLTLQQCGGNEGGFGGGTPVNQKNTGGTSGAGGGGGGGSKKKGSSSGKIHLEYTLTRGENPPNKTNAQTNDALKRVLQTTMRAKNASKQAGKGTAAGPAVVKRITK